ncbi:unnamed protein product [Medioppia subpectinata]|uniref:Elongation of very long chain fatty acids protein n=1 Tax=Medioppia subpectinata TaxID=1979941 RepID=A0A7R9PV25_9ACAR|nr:unnamed protein product [Medioppia subpectinata]CAG2101849.1 unnamed protein product [Medioppia subpectinata]
MDWPLMGSPIPILTLILSYIYFVKVLGPMWMKDKTPFRIEGLIVVYNIVMVFTSAFIFIIGGQMTYFGKYSLICEPIDYSGSDESMRLVRLGWWLLLLKIVEFADTVFFVLRKKFTHISVLHVVHHSLVAWGVWVGMKFGAGGHNAFFPLMNCGIHTIMYTYYCLAALGPTVRKHLWWKRYLTIVQMVQFVVALIHACIPLFVDCGYHPGFAYALIAHAVLFWVMFYNFYRNNYNQMLSKSRHNNNNTAGSYAAVCNQNANLCQAVTKTLNVSQSNELIEISKKIN